MWLDPINIINLPFFRIYIFDTISSTNDIAKAFKKDVLVSPSPYPIPVFIANSQSSGRGRRGKKWVSSNGNLYVSFLFHSLPLPFLRLSELSFVLGIALFETVHFFTKNSNKIQLKWPNDLLIQNKKAAGILLETDSNGTELPWVIGGVGLNIISSPQELSYPTTCLQDILGKKVPPPSPLLILEILCQKLILLLIPFLEENTFEFIRKKWLSYAAFLNKKIAITTENITLTGIFEDLDEKGALILNMGKEKRIVSSGDIFFYESND